MKRIFLLLALVFALLTVGVHTGCNWPPSGNAGEGNTVQALGEAPKVVTQTSTEWDTLSTSTSLDTLTFDLGTYWGPMDYEFGVRWDSLSGGTTGSFYIEWSPDASGTFWLAHSTVTTIDGVSGYAKITGEIIRGRLRGRAYAPSSTQSTAVRVSGNLVSRVPN